MISILFANPSLYRLQIDHLPDKRMLFESPKPERDSKISSCYLPHLNNSYFMMTIVSDAAAIVWRIKELLADL